jgi:DNA-binding NarL/FixJ family response regulator
VRVAIADDAMLLREGVARLLTEAGFDVVAQSSTAEDLLKKVRACSPDVAIIDIRMPPTHTDEGMRAAREIRAAYPGMGIVILSQHADIGVAAKLLADSAVGVGYMLKESIEELDEFAEAVRRVAKGGSVLDPAIVSQLLRRQRVDDPIERLAPREREVLQLMAEGRSNQGIAERLDLSERSVQAQVAGIFERLGLPASGDDHRRVLAVLAFLRS